MAMIAPIVSFVFEPCLVAGGGDKAGEGEGGGRIGEHGLRGSPHNREFPMKDEFGNF